MSPVHAQHRHRVVIAGGGVAGLEALLALHTLAGEYVTLTLLEPSDGFALRALSVQDPFAPAEPRRYDLQRICDEHGARLVHAKLDAVDVDGGSVRTDDGETLPYDSLLLALGARAIPVHPEAMTFGGARDGAALQHVLEEIERGAVRSVAFVIPPRTTWTLPLYELALMTAQRARALELDGLTTTVITPEAAPLQVFGADASAAVARELADAGVDVVTCGYTEDVRDGVVVVHHAGGQLDVTADRVVALPRLEGPAVPGVPHDHEGFLPIDQHGAVRGVEGVYAAGDGTDFPVKQGGIAAQQADAAAREIADRAGVDVERLPFHPTLRGQLYTGSGSRFLTQLLTGGGGETSRASSHALWWPPSKVAAPYLAPYLERLEAREEGFIPADGPDPADPEVEVLGRFPVTSRLGSSGPGGTHQRRFARELPRERWHDLLDEIAAERADTRTVIEVDAGEGAQTAERGLLLRVLAYDDRDDVFEVAVARPRPGGEDVMRHHVDRPARVLVDSREGVLPRAIAIDDDAGTRMLVRLVDDAAFSG